VRIRGPNSVEAAALEVHFYISPPWRDSYRLRAERLRRNREGGRGSFIVVHFSHIALSKIRAVSPRSLIPLLKCCNARCARLSLDEVGCVQGWVSRNRSRPESVAEKRLAVICSLLRASLFARFDATSRINAYVPNRNFVGRIMRARPMVA
jgi:hypothetical protein